MLLIQLGRISEIYIYKYQPTAWYNVSIPLAAAMIIAQIKEFIYPCKELSEKDWILTEVGKRA